MLQGTDRPTIDDHESSRWGIRSAPGMKGVGEYGKLRSPGERRRGYAERLVGSAKTRWRINCGGSDRYKIIGKS